MRTPTVLPHIEDFARSALLDNRLAVLSLEAGESLTLQEVIDLESGVRALYITVALQCRSHDFIEGHRKLWTEAHQFFAEAWQIWEHVVPQNELITSHQRLLQHLCDVSADQVEFYADVDRAAYRRRKETGREIKTEDFGEHMVSST